MFGIKEEKIPFSLKMIVWKTNPYSNRRELWAEIQALHANWRPRQGFSIPAVRSPSLGKLHSVLGDKFPFNKCTQHLLAQSILPTSHSFVRWGHSFIHYFWEWHSAEKAAWEVLLLYLWKMRGRRIYRWYRVVKERNGAVSALNGMVIGQWRWIRKEDRKT